MTKAKTTKRALLMSALALLLCVSMLVGSTFAWFTDSVTSGRNKIVAGNLDVVLEYKTPDATDWTEVTSDTVLFSEDSLWEPGHTEVVALRIRNAGTLTLKYDLATTVYKEKIGTNVAGESFKLSDYLEIGYTAVQQDGAVGDILMDMFLGSRENAAGLANSAFGEPVDNPNPVLLPGAAHVCALAITMPETVGNEANYKTGTDAPYIRFGVTLVATQQPQEKDSFDNQYDKDAKYPLGKTVVLEGSVADHEATVVVPEDAPAYNYKQLLFDDISYTNDNGNVSMKFDMSLADEAGNPIPAASLECPVAIVLPHPFVNTDSLQVLHNGQPVEGVTYDPATRTIRFTTTGFSPFELKYVDYVDPTSVLEYVEENGQFTITKGMFVGKNPADFDESLKATDSKHIAVDFQKDGVTYYVVSERATTVFVAADGTTAYEGENGTFSAKSGQSGKLWSLISGLQNNAHSTVYLLPGTYNEGTTINVYSSMDIIGLGDTDEVKVVKQSSSSSNRHLFNCNGSKADYIQVTLRNLYLDATAKTTDSKDNAAVQSIRKTKVKCYDLTIVKGTGGDAVAFYVNGNNAVDGVKHPAYLYAENCTLNAANTFNIVTTSGTYKFYHNNLTYSGKDYTNNSGSIKNMVMAAGDWDWDT